MAVGKDYNSHDASRGPSAIAELLVLYSTGTRGPALKLVRGEVRGMSPQ